MVQAAELYYEQDMTQKQISQVLGISRPRVSLLLQAARREGIVKVTVHRPSERASTLAREIMDRFGIEVLVVPSYHNAELTLSRAARTAAQYLKSQLEDGQVLGIGRGASVYATVRSFEIRPVWALTVVPLAGGVGPYDARFQVNEMVRMTADRLGGQPVFLNAPAFTTSPEVRRILSLDPDIARVEALWCDLALSLVGIGTIERASDPDYMARVHRIRTATGRRLVADICGRMLDAEGREVCNPDDHVVAAPLAELQRSRQVIAVACGSHKALAIRAALAGTWLNVLATDELAAEALMRLAELPR